MILLNKKEFKIWNVLMLLILLMAFSGINVSASIPDADGDGVWDSGDFCPNTSLSSSIDLRTGCSCEDLTVDCVGPLCIADDGNPCTKLCVYKLGRIFPNFPDDSLTCGAGHYCSNGNCLIGSISDKGNSNDYSNSYFPTAAPILSNDEECRVNQDCSDKQYCSSNACVDVLSCECGVIRNHQCNKFECCKNSDCNSNQCDLNLNFCISSSPCKKLISSGSSKDKLDLLIVGDGGFRGYSELNEFVNKLFNGFTYTYANSDRTISERGVFSYEPFVSNLDRFNVWVYHDTRLSGTPNFKKPSKAKNLNDYYVLCPEIEDVGVVYTKTSFRSFAYFGEGSHLSMTKSFPDVGLYLHELGHSTFLLADEYTEKQLGDRPRYPNCAGSRIQAEQWWGDVPDAKIIAGCSYVNSNFRAHAKTIMLSTNSLTYGDVSLRYIQTILNKYTTNGGSDSEGVSNDVNVSDNNVLDEGNKNSKSEVNKAKSYLVRCVKIDFNKIYFHEETECLSIFKKPTKEMLDKVCEAEFGIEFNSFDNSYVSCISPIKSYDSDFFNEITK